MPSDTCPDGPNHAAATAALAAALQPDNKQKTFYHMMRVNVWSHELFRSYSAEWMY
jgi:hypothetical protein